MELILVRHGRPHRVEGADGRADPGLTDEGRAQAVRVGEWLGTTGVDRIVVSPLRRARETVEPLARRSRVEPEVVPGLGEIDVHAKSYIPIEEMRREGGPQLEAMRAGRWSEVGFIDPLVFQAEVVEACAQLIARCGEGDERVVAVCHGGVINVYLADVLGLARPFFFEPSYCSISRVHIDPDGHRIIRSINETAHLVGVEGVAHA